MRLDMGVKKEAISKRMLKRLRYPNWPPFARIDESVPLLAKLLQKGNLLSKLVNPCSLIGLSVSERSEITGAASHEAGAQKLFYILSHRAKSSFVHFCDMLHGLKGGDDLYQCLTTKERKNAYKCFAGIQSCYIYLSCF